MPIPLIWAAGAAALAAATAVVGLVVLNQLNQKVAGKTVLIVGPRLAGKSLLHLRLTSGKRSATEIGGTDETFRFTTGDVAMDQLDWDVSVTDAPSTQRVSHEIAEHLSQANLVVFLADASLLGDDAYRSRAETLATSFRALVTDDNVEWALLLSHADLVEDDAPVDRWSARLAKTLDEKDPLLCDLTDQTSSGTAIHRVLKRVTKEVQS